MKSELYSTYAKQYESYEMVELVKEKFGGQVETGKKLLSVNLYPHQELSDTL